MGGLGVQPVILEEKGVRDEVVDELEQEKKQWIRRKVELLNFNGSDLMGWLV